jgi:hypothetical protein
MARVVVAPTRVAAFPEGGGHFWVYMQYVQGLRRAGCEVHWLETLEPGGDPAREARLIENLERRLAAFGLQDRLLLHAPPRFLNLPQARAAAICRDADLLLNFRYDMQPEVLALFRRTALVDIDPGLLQFWMSTGQIAVSPHDVYFTIAETVGTPAARFPDCGLPWVHIRPPVSLDLWPYAFDGGAEAFTTVSGWSGEEWIQDGEAVMENTKRVSFLRFLELPRRTNRVLELALDLGHGDPDAADRIELEAHGWRVRPAREVSARPEQYRAYIQASRGELGCAKPFHVQQRTAWISDRTVCYLASGKPAVVQDTGPSRYLPQGEGLFRFTTLDEAAAALAAIEHDYERHCRAAREIAETCFDARDVAAVILNQALPGPRLRGAR